MPSRFLACLLLLFPPLALVTLALPRFIAGIPIESEREAVNMAISGLALPHAAARQAVRAFARAPSGDGESLAWQAEFAAMHGADPGQLSAAGRLAEQALIAAPENPRAWTVLCRIRSSQSAARGVACLDMGFFVAPYDWYMAGPRMAVVAANWPYLDERLRDAAAARVLPMWNTTGWPGLQTLRYALGDLSGSDNGRQLLRAGFAGKPDTLREFNRWTIEEMLDGR